MDGVNVMIMIMIYIEILVIQLIQARQETMFLMLNGIIKIKII